MEKRKAKEVVLCHSCHGVLAHCHGADTESDFIKQVPIHTNEIISPKAVIATALGLFSYYLSLPREQPVKQAVRRIMRHKVDGCVIGQPLK